MLAPIFLLLLVYFTIPSLVTGPVLPFEGVCKALIPLTEFCALWAHIIVSTRKHIW